MEHVLKAKRLDITIIEDLREKSPELGMAWRVTFGHASDRKHGRSGMGHTLEAAFRAALQRADEVDRDD